MRKQSDTTEPTVVVSLRVERSLQQALAKEAERQERPLANFLRLVLRRGLEALRGKAATR